MVHLGLRVEGRSMWPPFLLQRKAPARGRGCCLLSSEPLCRGKPVTLHRRQIPVEARAKLFRISLN